MLRKFSFSCLLLLSIISFSNAQTFHEEVAQLAMDNNLIGLSVAVICDGEVVDVFHYGKADLARDFDVDDETIYRIASISKMVSSTALMKLYDQGHFELDDNISDYLGYILVNPYHPLVPITFRMVLSHTSGLQDGNGYFDFLSATYNQTPVPPISSLLLPNGSYYSFDMWRGEQPGTFFNYSNVAFGLTATLIEKISGQRFDQYVKTELLEPLGITGSFNIQDIEDIDDVAVLYRNSNPQSDNYQGNYPPPFNPSNYTIGDNGLYFSPQGGLRVSALDLSKFLIFHAKQGLVDGEYLIDSTTISLMHQPVWTYDGFNGNNYFNLFNQWGLGIQSTTNTTNGDIVIDSVTMYGHPGEAYGLISDLYFEKDKRFGLVFMTNGYYGAQNYQFGESSAFYVPEEQLFTLINQYHYQSCTPIVSNTLEQLKSLNTPNYYYDQLNHQIHQRNTVSEGQLALYSISGQLIEQQTFSNSTISLPALPVGIYMARITSNNEEQHIIIPKAW